MPGADANPYLALAAALASGLWGVEHEIEPSPPVTGNAYESPPMRGRRCRRRWARRRPGWPARGRQPSCWAVRSSSTSRRSREWEERQFRRAVTDWELRRYLEVIMTHEPSAP